jgi:hypothetical protein
MTLKRRFSKRSTRLRLLCLESRLAPAVWTVNTLADDGSGSGNSGTLRYCIAQANTNPGDDTINIAVNGTIMLANGQFTLTDTTGQTTINGPGANLLTIDAHMASRAIQINSSVTASISGVRVTGGRLVGTSGGGINNAGTLMLANSMIDGNSVSILNNAGGAGGGILSNGALAITNCTISGNSATNGGYGAGIQIASGTANVVSSMVSGNSANGAAGGIDNDGALMITDSTISNNSGGTSGGIHSNGSLSITNSTISGNHAVDYGGGIYGVVTLTNSTVTGNTLTGSGILNGGGIYGSGTISNCTISQNSAGSGRGGGIFNAFGLTLTITNSLVTGNTAGQNSGGGGIFTGNYGTVSLNNSTVSGNSAGAGGGICNSSNQTVTLHLTNCSITRNHAYSEGGAISNGGSGATATITSSTISGNSATDFGGGIANDGPATLTLANSTVTGNTAGNNASGGIYNHILGTANAKNSIVAGNQPMDIGGEGGITTNDHNLLNMSAAAAGLGTLGNFGGPTQTIPLLPGSPAINGGTSNNAPTTDQRGLPRFGAVDIGAFEVQAAPVVLSTRVNDGSVQRSRVTSLTVTFNYVVSFAGTVASAFTLTRTGGGAVNFAANANVVNGVTVVTLNDFSGAETQFGSLGDGRYTLTALQSPISANGAQLDGNYDGVGGDNYNFTDAQGLFRFYGDINGDRHVDIADFGLFATSYGLHTGQSGFLAAFDFNNDGVIDIQDFGQFALRFFTVLP